MAAAHNIRRVTQAELARELGVSRQAISDQVARGIISPDAEGTFDVDLARMAIAERVRPSSKTAQAVIGGQGGSSDQQAAGRQVGGGEMASLPALPPSEYHNAKTMRELADAQMAQVKLAERTGKLVEAQAAHLAVFDLFRMLRDAVFTVPARTTPRLIGMADAREIERIQADELRAAFKDWEDKARQRLPGSATGEGGA